mmetsp:Transcript_54532/g.144087  ORF Transcript_54532/g.144087 Transcript_54532/m.144087 type:complete len:154 (+) Transcript_54532:308-769(+)
MQMVPGEARIKSLSFDDSFTQPNNQELWGPSASIACPTESSCAVSTNLRQLGHNVSGKDSQNSQHLKQTLLSPGSAQLQSQILQFNHFSQGSDPSYSIYNYNRPSLQLFPFQQTSFDLMQSQLIAHATLQRQQTLSPQHLLPSGTLALRSLFI